MVYKHGGNIKEVANDFKIDESAIIDFSANINPLGMSTIARQAILESVDRLVQYPDRNNNNLIAALSNCHSIPSENILVGGGATEFIYLLPRVLKPKKALIVMPAFSEYERALQLVDCKVDHFILSEELDFNLDLPRLIKKMNSGYDTLWIANMSNPSGALISKDDLQEVIKEADKQNIQCVIDEAFIEYAEEESIKHTISHFPNVVIIRSMTKFFALPGLRVGYIFGNEKFINKVKSHQEPWTLSIPGEAAAIASLKDSLYIEESLTLMEKERAFLFSELEAIPALTPFPSRANFILIKLGLGVSSDKFQQSLLKDANILIRDCSNYVGLNGQFIRVAVKNREENSLLIEAIRHFIVQQKGGGE